MKITELNLTFIRGFVAQHSIQPSERINLFVGKNNAGKSTILNSIYIIQNLNALTPSDISKDRHEGRIELHLDGIPEYIVKHGANVFSLNDHNRVSFNFTQTNIERVIHNADGNGHGFGEAIREEPKNLIYPYLSRRKVGGYSETVNKQATHSVMGNLTHLYAKIDRLSKPAEPAHEQYKKACEEILGFLVTTVVSDQGQIAAYLIDTFQNIPLTSMGEGVPNLLGLIVDLCVAENKIFLIEEPENDIHPKALKALLELIAKKSETNQFFISTHSNIVTKYLGSVEEAKVFRISMTFEEKLPHSKIEEVENNEVARRELLEELGYEFQDYDLHKAWLFLEESSAEAVVRDFLIPNFAEGLLGKIKTFAANGKDKIKLKFDDFHHLFVFLNLQPIYKNRVWIIIDAGQSEKVILDDLKDRYLKKGWQDDNFLQLSKHDFEEYYPKSFAEKVSETLAIKDKGVQKEKKKELIEEVKQWWKENPDQAKTEFEESAAEIIQILKTIEKQLKASMAN